MWRVLLCAALLVACGGREKVDSRGYTPTMLEAARVCEEALTAYVGNPRLRVQAGDVWPTADGKHYTVGLHVAWLEADESIGSGVSLCNVGRGPHGVRLAAPIALSEAILARWRNAGAE